MTQNLDDMSLRTLCVAAIIRQFYHDFMPIHCIECCVFWHKNILRHFSIIRNNKSYIFIPLEGTHNGMNSTLQNLNDLAIPPSSMTFTVLIQPYLYRITMKSPSTIRFRNEYVFFLSLHAHKTKSPLGCHKFSRHDIFFWQTNPPPAVYLDFPMGD